MMVKLTPNVIDFFFFDAAVDFLEPILYDILSFLQYKIHHYLFHLDLTLIDTYKCYTVYSKLIQDRPSNKILVLQD